MLILFKAYPPFCTFVQSFIVYVNMLFSCIFELLKYKIGKTKTEVIHVNALLPQITSVDLPESFFPYIEIAPSVLLISFPENCPNTVLLPEIFTKKWRIS